MKLFYAPGACSQAPHILLHEIGLSHDAEQVDLKAKTLASGGPYLDINPKGAVPALQLDSGEVLTENAVVLQYLGDRAGSDVLPSIGQFRRYRVLEWTNFITTELHKGFGPLFKSDAGDEVKAFARKNVSDKLDFVEKQFGEGPFLLGDELTIADPYLFVITRWAEKMLDAERWPKLAKFRAMMIERPSVQHVLRSEGLLEPQPAA